MKDPERETHRIVEETKEYYRQRANRYSDWSQRNGDYEGGSPPDDSFFAEARIVLEALHRRQLDGDVLEIAAGTGILTEVLVKSASSVTALDSSREMLERCKLRLAGNPYARYVAADFYEWIPDRVYDAVASSFWISHVPKSKFDEFASKVSRCLGQGGRLFFVDQRIEAKKSENYESARGEVAKRTLEDGREFRIVKHFYQRDEIRERFLRVGIDTEFHETPTHFYYFDGAKSGR